MFFCKRPEIREEHPNAWYIREAQYRLEELEKEGRATYIMSGIGSGINKYQYNGYIISFNEFSSSFAGFHILDLDGNILHRDIPLDTLRAYLSASSMQNTPFYKKESEVEDKELEELLVAIKTFIQKRVKG